MTGRAFLPIATLLVVALAGCTGPDIPPDAVRDTDPAVPDGFLAAWIDQADGVVQVNAVFQNGGDVLNVFDGYHFGAWNLTFLDDDGAPVLFNARLVCDDFRYDTLAPYAVEDFHYTWDTRSFDEYGECDEGQLPESHPVPAGNYTAVVGYLLAYEPDDALQVEIPFTVERE